jgi:hypothetical protein
LTWLGQETLTKTLLQQKKPSIKQIKRDLVLMKTTASALATALLITLLLVTSLPSLKADTGTPQAQWEKTYGPKDGYCAFQTSDGGFVIAGWEAVWDSSHVPGNWENGTSVLIKVNASGVEQWRKSFGRESEETIVIKSVLQTEDNGYVLSGYKAVSSGNTGISGVSSFFWLAKTDDEGNMQWNKTYVGPVYTAACIAIQTKDSGYALAGYTQSLEVDNGAWLVKATSSGAAEWQVLYAGDGTQVSSLIKTDDGAYAFTGTKDGVSSQSKIWFVKIAPDSIPHGTEPPTPEPPKPSYATWIAIATVIVAAGLSLGLLLYFKKRKH